MYTLDGVQVDIFWKSWGRFRYHEFSKPWWAWFLYCKPRFEHRDQAFWTSITLILLGLDIGAGFCIGHLRRYQQQCKRCIRWKGTREFRTPDRGKTWVCDKCWQGDDDKKLVESMTGNNG